MSAGKKRIPRNMARIEFMACRETIESLLAQGFDKKKIHARLAKDGQITMSYDSFCKVLIRASNNELNIQSLAPPPAPEPVERKPTTPVANPGSKIIKPSSDTLQDPRTVDTSKFY